MLYLFVRPQREPLDMIEYLACHAIFCDWTCGWVSQLVMFNHMLNHVTTQLVSFPWLGISISSHMNQYNQFQFWYGSIESDSLFLIPLDYSDSDILPFTFHVEDGKRCHQSHSRKYDWLVPDLTKNTRGCYILIFLGVLITPTKYGMHCSE